MAHPFPGEETTRTCGKYLIDMCKTAGVRPVIVETWAKKDEPQEQMNQVYRGMAVEKEGICYNIDSQAPNVLAREWTESGKAFPESRITGVRPEQF